MKHRDFLEALHNALVTGEWERVETLMGTLTEDVDECITLLGQMKGLVLSQQQTIADQAAQITTLQAAAAPVPAAQQTALETALADASSVVPATTTTPPAGGTTTPPADTTTPPAGGPFFVFTGDITTIDPTLWAVSTTMEGSAGETLYTFTGTPGSTVNTAGWTQYTGTPVAVTAPAGG